MQIINLPNSLTFKYIKIDYSDDFIHRMHAEGIVLPDNIEKAVLKRRCEYLAGRACVHRGFRERGVTSVHRLDTGESGQPLWQHGSIGSISHCLHHAIAVVGEPSSELSSVGIDIEQNISLELAEEIGGCIVSKQEQDILLHSFDFQGAITLAFSAKESIYKAIFPFVARVLDFDCVELVAVDATQCQLTFEFCHTVQAVFASPFIVHYSYDEGVFMTWCLF